MLRRAPPPGRAIAPSKGDRHDHDRAGVPRQRASMPVLGRVGERAGKQRPFFALAATWEGVASLGREIDRRAGNRGNQANFTPSGGCGLAVAAGPALCDELRQLGDVGGDAPKRARAHVCAREFAPTARQSRRMARRLLECHGVRRGALGVLSGHNEHPDPVMSGDPGLGRVMSGDAGFHPCIPGRCI